jgi:hypothetical protein
MKTMFAGMLATLGAALTITTVALADNEFSVTAGKGEVIVVPAQGYHVNKDYPWKVIAGDKTIDRSKWELGERQAKVGGVPAGTVRVKGAVCGGPKDACVPFEKEVKVN